MSAIDVIFISWALSIMTVGAIFILTAWEIEPSNDDFKNSLRSNVATGGGILFLGGVILLLLSW